METSLHTHVQALHTPGSGVCFMQLQGAEGTRGWGWSQPTSAQLGSSGAKTCPGGPDAAHRREARGLWKMLVFGECCLPCGRAAAGLGGTTMPWEVALMPRCHSPTSDIPHGCEEALPPAPALHAQVGQNFLPHKPRENSFQPVTPTRNRGWILWIRREMPQPCHQPLQQCHLSSATHLLPSSEPPSATSAVSSDRWQCHTSPPQLRATSPAPWESPCALPVRIQLCPWETELAHMPL